MGNVYATLWGLITFSGFVTTLLLPQADKYAQAYFESVTEASLDASRRWVRVVRQVPLWVLTAVLALSVLSPIVLWNGPDRATRWDFFLLAVAVVSQSGFAMTVRFLAPKVPASITELAPVPGSRRPGLASSRIGTRTTIRFVNHTGESLQLKWVDFEGALADYGPVPPGNDGQIRPTYVGHWFTICTTTNRELASFEAGPHPGIANINSSLLRADVPEQR